MHQLHPTTDSPVRLDYSFFNDNLMTHQILNETISEAVDSAHHKISELSSRHATRKTT